MNPDEAYLMSLRDLANVESSLVEAQVSIDDLSAGRIESIPSELNVSDYVCPVIFGVCGGLVSTSPMLRRWLDKIHTDATQPKPKTAMGKILAHRGDHTDKAKVGEELCQFVKRDGSRVGAQGMHRLFYGHDPFSIGADNPFVVLSKQYGLVRGIVQALRHLLADTFSKQGLPIPFHSFLDYSSSGNLDNWLGTWASKLKGNSGINQMEAFGHIGTIRMQDFMSQGLTWALCKIYIRMAGIEDKSRACQVRLVAYGTHFLSHMMINQLRYGIPGINYVALAMTVKAFGQFMWLNYSDLRELEKKTDVFGFT